jgi:hypothetical protein
MENKHVEALEGARRFLVERRRNLSAGIIKLSEGDFDRVMRHADYLTAVQGAIEAIARAIKEEEAVDHVGRASPPRSAEASVEHPGHRA